MRFHRKFQHWQTPHQPEINVADTIAINSEFQPILASHFKTVHIAITTADCMGQKIKFYKLLYVLLDTSICSLAMVSLIKR